MNNYNPPCGNTVYRQGYGMAMGFNGQMPRAESECKCKKAHLPADTALAMAYVPFQQSGEVYPLDKALSRGTAFPCLDKPFMGCCK